MPKVAAIGLFSMKLHQIEGRNVLQIVIFSLKIRQIEDCNA